MTLINSKEIKCLKCGYTFSAIVHDSINVSMLPHLKDEFLNGELNKTVCPECNTAYNLVGAVLYHDMHNGIMIQVLLSEEYSNNKEAAIREFTEKIRGNVSGLTGAMRKNFERYYFDIVFSLDELKESLDSIAGVCSEKIRAITEEVLRLEPKHKERSPAGRIRMWFEKLLPAAWRKDEVEHSEELSSPEKYIVILGEKFSLKYFPNLKLVAEIDPKGLENTICKIMNKHSLDAKNAMVSLETLTRRIGEVIDEKPEKKRGQVHFSEK